MVHRGEKDRDAVDGSAADVTVTFALDGVQYSIALSRANANRLRSELAPWVSCARRTGGRAKRSGAPAHIDRSQLAKVREWAVQNGLAVNARGRIPTAVHEAWSQAHA